MSKKLRIYYDEKGETVSVWFDDPKKEAISEEIGDGTIVSKDKEGKIIGVEKLKDITKRSSLEDYFVKELGEHA